ncbi:MAG: thermosome subunit alpha [Candidatus Bathyarchaeia archaeon]
MKAEGLDDASISRENVLRRGAKCVKGLDARRSNIYIAASIKELIKGSLGPEGRDKLIVNPKEGPALTSDGYIMLRRMKELADHPVVNILYEATFAMKNEYGDGKKSILILAGELLKKAYTMIGKKIHPAIIVEGYSKAASKALEALREMSEPLSTHDVDGLRSLAKTAMCGGLSDVEAERLAELAAHTIQRLSFGSSKASSLELDMVKLISIPGGAVSDSELVEGVVIKNDVLHQNMPRRVENAGIALMTMPLEMKKVTYTHDGAKLEILTPENWTQFLDEERKCMLGLVEALEKAGAKLVLTQWDIDNYVQYELAERGIMAAERVKEEDLLLVAKATDAKLIKEQGAVSPEFIGFAGLVEEKRVQGTRPAERRWIFIRNCRNPRSATIIVRGVVEERNKEVGRSLKNALRVLKAFLEEGAIVGGAGSTEMELSFRLRSWARGLPGKEQIAALAFADALEEIPAILAENLGLDPLETVMKLRAEHHAGKKWAGVDARKRTICEDVLKEGIIEPYPLKAQVIKTAAEISTLLLRIDDQIYASRSREARKPREIPQDKR